MDVLLAPGGIGPGEISGDLLKMPSHPVTQKETQEAYQVAALKSNESGLARCYLQVYQAARRVTSLDASGCDPAAKAAIEALRKVVPPLAHTPPRPTLVCTPAVRACR
jgi:hypothetical protein